jgi:hypothetical protein
LIQLYIIFFFLSINLSIDVSICLRVYLSVCTTCLLIDPCVHVPTYLSYLSV